MTTQHHLKQAEEFWRNHLTEYQKSKQSKTSYAKSQGLNYWRFLYWIGKLAKTDEPKSDAPTKLLPIKVIHHPKSPTLASIKIAGGYCIEIHDINALLCLLERQ